MSAPKIVAFAGSLRRDSWNRKILRFAVEGARAAGADVTEVDLRDHPMPLYDGEIESATGLPESARALQALMLAHDGLLVASPEYNTSITGVLKNTIDWVSRPSGGVRSLAAFDGKVAGLVAASPGPYGGMRSLLALRAVLGNIRVIVIPEQVAVPRVNEAFDADGNLRDAKQADALRNVGARVAAVAGALARARSGAG